LGDLFVCAAVSLLLSVSLLLLLLLSARRGLPRLLSLLSSSLEEGLRR